MNINIKTFDIVLTPPFGLASFTQSFTIAFYLENFVHIHRSRRYKRKEKIKRIWNL